METALLDAYVVDRLKRWGREIAGASSTSHLGYPSQSTVYVAMRFAGRSPRSNVRAPEPDIDPAVWLVEVIVAQIARYDIRMAVVLRAAFCGYGTWVERVSLATKLLERSGGVAKMSRSQYYDLRERGIAEVRDYLLFDEAA